MELLPAVLLLAAGLAGLVALVGPARRSALTVLGLLVAAGVAGAAAGWWGPAPAEPPSDRPIQVPVDGYVSSDTCRSCHPDQYASWHASWHRTMTQVITPTSVMGDFDGDEREIMGKRYRMFREGDEFWAEFPISPAKGEGYASEERLRVQLTMSTGSHHMQVYWYPAGPGRMLGMLPLFYMRSEQRWVPWSSVFVRTHYDHGQEDLGRWNATCIKCHATGGRPRLLDASVPAPREAADTDVGEFGIACEACHGPGAEHVAANRNPVRRYQLHSGAPDAAGDDTIVNPARLSAARSADICGQCHAFTVPRTLRITLQSNDGGSPYRPGGALEDSRILLRHTEDGVMKQIIAERPNFVRNRFWSDGMVRVGGREFHALRRTPCYTHGDEVRGVLDCRSCHALHQSSSDPRPPEQWADDQLGEQMRTNRACLGCHADYEDGAVLAQHTHHAPDSSGSVCYNCHMPFTAWGLLKATRSHEISNPSVQETLETTRPNACNACHLDRTLAWTGQALQRWYGIEPPPLSPEQQTIPSSVLDALRGDAGVRALSAWAMGWAPAMAVSGDGWRAQPLTTLLEDPYDVVRYNAIRSLRRQQGYEDVVYDYLGSPSERTYSAAGVWERWRKAPRGGVALDPDTYTRLYEQRDDRPIHLVE